MTKTPIFKTLALLSLVVTAALGARDVQAQSIGQPCIISPTTIGLVTVFNSGPGSSAPLGLCASEATLSGINKYLQTGEAQSVVGKAAAAAGASSGLVGQIALMNSQDSSFRNQKKNDLANQDVRDRTLAVEEEISESVYEATQPISRRACYSSLSSGAGGGAGGGASARSAAKVAEMQQKDTLKPGTEADYAARVVQTPGHEDSCTKQDVDNKIPGCSNVGGYPGVNTSPFILVRAYTGRKDKPSSYTIVDDESDPLFRAQQGYLNYSKPRPGPAIPDGLKDSPNSKRYLVMQRRYNSRTLAVVNAMSQISGETIALPSSSPFVRNVWNGSAVPGVPTLKEDYAAVYGQAAPTLPSEREVMNLLVLRQFTAKQSGADLGSTPTDIARRQLEVKKINALLLLKLNEKAEWNNIMYAHILSNRIDPVDRNQLVSAAAAAR